MRLMARNNGLYVLHFSCIYKRVYKLRLVIVWRALYRLLAQAVVLISLEAKKSRKRIIILKST